MVRGPIERLPESRARFLVVDYRRTPLGEVPDSYMLAYAVAEPTASSAASETASALADRLPRPNLTAEELRARSWWRGPEVYLVVDDYDLVATPAGTRCCRSCRTWRRRPTSASM